MNLQTCQCEPVTGAVPPQCQNNSDCPRCQTCSGGHCAQRLCPAGQRMNLDTCQCEPVPVPRPQCHNNAECPLGEICRKGKCIKKPPPIKQRPPSRSEPVDMPDLFEDNSGQGIPRSGIGPGGISIGGGGGQGVAPVQRVPRQIAPVQRIPRTPPSKPR